MLVPLIRTLQAHFPRAKLTWVISRPAYNLVEGMDGVEFIVIAKPNSLADYWQFGKRMRSQQFDVLLAAQASFRANLLYPLIRAKRKIGFDKLRAKDGHGWFVQERITPGDDHTLESFLKFAEVLDIKEKKIAWDLPISTDDHQWARAHLPSATNGPVFLLNAAASKPERSWPVSRYIEVIKYVQQAWGAQVVLTGGPGDYDQLLAEAIGKEVAVMTLVGKTQPKQLLAVIQQADLLLCPDTGPSHMAAAVATPVIALHAVTSAEVSGPYIYKHLAVDCYPQAREVILKKNAENNVWGTHAHGENTMALISVEAVINKLETVFTMLGYSSRSIIQQ